MRATLDCWTAADRRTWVAESEVSLDGALPTADEVTAGLEAQYLAHAAPLDACTGCAILLSLTARNTGGATWTRAGLVWLGFRWTTDGGQIVGEGRIPLERQVSPGQEVVVDGWVIPPATPGTYQLAFGLLQQRPGSIHHLGVTPAMTTVRIGAVGGGIR
jgi:hypothetical protein